MENLTGAADNQDMFVFKEGGRLSGVADGGDGGFDTLLLEDGGYSSVTFTATGPDSGWIALDANVIHYSGLEPLIANTGTATDIQLNLPENDDLVELRHVAGNEFILVSLNDTFEDTTFTDPGSGGSVTIDLGAGQDKITLTDANSLQASLTVKGGGNQDTFSFRGTSLDSQALLSGLDELVAWADTLDNAGKLGQALAVVSGNVGVGVGLRLRKHLRGPVHEGPAAAGDQGIR